MTKQQLQILKRKTELPDTGVSSEAAILQLYSVQSL